MEKRVGRVKVTVRSCTGRPAVINAGIVVGAAWEYLHITRNQLRRAADKVCRGNDWLVFDQVGGYTPFFESHDGSMVAHVSPKEQILSPK